MSDISVRTGRSFLNENQSWVAPGGKSGLRDMDSITLARSAFDLVTNFPNGFIPSGVVLGKITAGGATENMYGPYDDAATDGRQVAVGHLGVSVKVPTGSTGNVAAALYWRGEVVEANLPAHHGLDTAAKTDLSRVKYI